MDKGRTAAVILFLFSLPRRIRHGILRIWSGASIVLEYRLYFLAAGHIVAAQDLLCEDDDQATIEAEARGDGRAMELWRGAVRVRQFPQVGASEAEPG